MYVFGFNNVTGRALYLNCATSPKCDGEN